MEVIIGVVAGITASAGGGALAVIGNWFFRHKLGWFRTDPPEEEPQTSDPKKRLVDDLTELHMRLSELESERREIQDALTLARRLAGPQAAASDGAE